MRYRTGALAIMLAAATGWLVIYAAGPDDYYGGGVSRWDHADRWGKTPIVAAAIAISGATVIGLLISAFAPSSRWQRLTLPTTALSVVMLLTAWFFLTGGH